MQATQRVLEQEIFVDHRSRGCLEWKIDAEGKQVLQFTDFTKEHRPKPVEKKFPNEAAFWRYLERIRTDIDTWKIADKREKKQKLIYVHREPFGELEFFTSEFSLNQMLCKEGDGGVQIEQCDIPLTERTLKYIVDEGSFWQSMLTVFTSEAAFTLALEKQLAQQASYTKWLGVGFIASAVGSPLLWRFSERARISALCEDDSGLLPCAMERAQGEVITSNFLSGLFDTPWSTPAVDVFIPQLLPLVMTSTLLIEGMSLSQNCHSTLLPFFLVGGATYLPTVAADNVNYLEVLGGSGEDKGYAVSVTSDGGSVVVGSTNSFEAGGFDDVLLAKVDGSGNVVWARTLGGSGNDHGTAVSAHSDGGSVVVGNTGSFGGVLLAKVDGSGNLVWALTLHGDGYNFGNAVSATSDGGSVVVGSTGILAAGNSHVLLAKVDGSGNFVWARTLGGSGYDQGNAVSVTSDGGSVVVGSTGYGAGDYDVLLAKVDGSGNLVWARTLGGLGNDGGTAVSATSDGGSVVVGYTYSFGAGNSDVLLAKVDGSGNLKWARTLGGSAYDAGTAVSATSDGGSVVVGRISFGAGVVGDVQIAKVDGSGNLVWARTLGGSSDGCGFAVSATSDGGSVVVGYTNSFGAGNYDVLLAKVDVSGNLPGYSGSQFISPSFATPALISSTISPSVQSPAINFFTPSLNFITIQLSEKTVYHSTGTSTSTSIGTSSPSQALLIGGAVGGIAGLGAIVGICCWSKKRRQQSARIAVSPITPEVNTIIIKMKELQGDSLDSVITIPNIAISQSPFFETNLKSLHSTQELLVRIKSFAMLHYGLNPMQTVINGLAVPQTAALLALSERYVAVAKGNDIEYWDIILGACLTKLQGHTAEVCCLAVTPSGHLVSASADGNLRVWQLNDSRCLHTLQRKTGIFQDEPTPVRALVALSDNRILSCETGSNKIYEWQVDTGQVSHFSHKHRDMITIMTKLADGTLVTGDAQEMFFVYDGSKGTRRYAINEGDTLKYRLVAVLQEGFFVTVSANTLILRSTVTGQVSKTLPLSLINDNAIEHIAYLSDKRHLLVNDKIIDTHTDTVVQTLLPGHTFVSPDGMLGQSYKNIFTRMDFLGALLPPAWKQLFAVLAKNTAIRHWDLSDMSIPEDAYSLLLTAFGQHSSLQVLDVSRSSITEEQLLQLWVVNILRQTPCQLLFSDINAAKTVITLQQQYATRLQSDAACTLWHLAVQEKHMKLLDILKTVRPQQPLHIASVQGYTPLYEAVKRGYKKVVRQLAGAPLKPVITESKEALYQLALLYEEGEEDVKPDITEAIAYYQKALQEGNKQAAYRLGQLYSQGKGVKQHFTEAVKYYLDAVKGQIQEAYTPLAQCYAAGNGVSQNMPEAFKYYQLASQQNNVEALCQVGICLEEGKGTAQDLKEAARYYEMAAKQKHAEALYRLGLLYLQGQGVKQSIEEACKFFYQAAQRKHVLSQFCLALLYHEGKTQLISEREATLSIEAVAQGGDALAQCSLGVLYEEGRGVPADNKQALAWYQKAAVQSYAPAQYHLGRLYELGKGMTKDVSEAIKCYLRAADQDYELASERISTLYEEFSAMIVKYQERFKKEKEKGKYAIFSAQLHLGAVATFFAPISLKQRSFTVSGDKKENRRSSTEQPRLIASPKMSSSLEFSLNIPYKELEFKEELGRGGFGVVYRGTYCTNDVAIKKLGVHLTGDLLKEFERETQLHAQLRCPQVVQLYGISTDADCSIVMEYMANGSLYSVLKSNLALDWSRRYSIALDVVKGLHYLHHRNILHRDLKSLNVLLNEHWQAKLCDFGLAKLKEAGVGSSSGNQQVGTLPWMAPEIFEGEKFTEQSDIYGYGMVLWELASRDVPFKNIQNASVMIPRLVADKNEREKIPESTPIKFGHLIKRCWDKDQGKRPKSDELISELKVMCEEERAVAEIPTMGPVSPVNSSFRGNFASSAGVPPYASFFQSNTRSLKEVGKQISRIEEDEGNRFGR